MRRRTYKTRVQIALIFDVPPEGDPRGRYYGTLKLIESSGWNRMRNLCFLGNIKARSRSGAARKAVHYLRRFVKNGAELVIYMEEA